MFEWITRPEKFCKELGLKQDAKEKTIKMDTFTCYHAKVVSVFKELFDELKLLFGDEVNDIQARFSSIY